MSANAIKPWVEVVSLHPDVLSPNFSEDIFALDLGPLADGNPQVPSVYRDPELITQLKKRVVDSLNPGKIVEFFQLGEGTPPKVGISTGEIVSGFYSFLGFTRLTADTIIRKAIVRGVKERAVGHDGKYQVTPAKVRFDAIVADDEIDLESGFILLPQAIPQPASAPTTSGTPTRGQPTGSNLPLLRHRWI